VLHSLRRPVLGEGRGGLCPLCFSLRQSRVPPSPVYLAQLLNRATKADYLAQYQYRAKQITDAKTGDPFELPDQRPLLVSDFGLRARNCD